MPLRTIRSLLIFVALGATLACANITLPFGTPTPAPPPTPVGNTLTFRVAPFTDELDAGQLVRGTQLEYLGWDGVAYRLRIDGREARRVAGDSVDWTGVTAPGVLGKYDLRLQNTNQAVLRVSGTAEYTILYPQPLVSTVPAGQFSSRDGLYFREIAVDFLVPPGSKVPGTDLTFNGQDGEGKFVLQGARVEYPYYRQADTVLWEGTLRPGTNVRYRLVVQGAETHGLRLRGSAELWIRTAPGVLPTPQATLLPTLTPAP